MDAEKIMGKLRTAGACGEGMDWVEALLRKHPEYGWRQIWDNCPIPSWLFWMLFELRDIFRSALPLDKSLDAVMDECREYVILCGVGLPSGKTQREFDQRLEQGDVERNDGYNWCAVDNYVGAVMAVKVPRATWGGVYFISRTVMKFGMPMSNIIRSRLTVKFEGE